MYPKRQPLCKSTKSFAHLMRKSRPRISLKLPQLPPLRTLRALFRLCSSTVAVTVAPSVCTVKASPTHFSTPCALKECLGLTSGCLIVGTRFLLASPSVITGCHKGTRCEFNCDCAAALFPRASEAATSIAAVKIVRPRVATPDPETPQPRPKLKFAPRQYQQHPTGAWARQPPLSLAPLECHCDGSTTQAREPQRK